LDDHRVDIYGSDPQLNAEGDERYRTEKNDGSNSTTRNMTGPGEAVDAKFGMKTLNGLGNFRERFWGQ